jgi:hypothetical protein
MPVSVDVDPFSGQPVNRDDLSLRTPQARVLAALAPDGDDAARVDWPVVTRAQLGVRAGYTAISGTITRALNGIRVGSSSGDAHPGLLVRGFVEEVVLDIDGTREVNYRITEVGIRAYRARVAERGPSLPPQRDKATCTNDRYRRSSPSPSLS